MKNQIEYLKRHKLEIPRYDSFIVNIVKDAINKENKSKMVIILGPER